MREISLAIVVAGLTAGVAGAPLAAQAPVVEERVEILEVGVLADLPASYRGRSPAELASRLVIAEDGVARAPLSVARVGGTGTDPYGRVLLVFDLERCSPEILTFAPAALGAEAERLVALGPVSIALLGEKLQPYGAATRSALELAQALAKVAREVACGPAPPPERLEKFELDAELLACPARPCLLAWAGPGWGRETEAPQAAPPSSTAVEPLAKRLASGGWTFLALPVSRAEPSEPKRRAPEPEYRPESGTYTFGINVLERRRSKRPLSADEYSTFVDLWLAPLRRLVAATAGEFAADASDLGAALEALGNRSILYYRAERRADAASPRLEVRAPGASGRGYRVPEWAPAAAP